MMNTLSTPAPNLRIGKAAASLTGRTTPLWRKAANVATGAIGAGVILSSAYVSLVRPWFLTWGATATEIGQALPGDEYVKTPPYVSTRAITIAAPSAQVWSWLVQIGQGRGGMYSYDWLENLFGCDIHSVNQVMPELQHLQVGDKVRMVSEDFPVPLVFDVALVDPQHALVLRTPGDPAANVAAGFPDASWAFRLQAIDPQHTRLIARWRANYKQGDRMSALWNHYGIEPVHFVMERKMLLGIKSRAESLAH